MNSAKESRAKPSNGAINRDDKDKDNTVRDNKDRKKFKSKRNQEKFVPSFKKKLPTWKQIDNELNELSERYDQA
jgi:hypothetical protein